MAIFLQFIDMVNHFLIEKFACDGRAPKTENLQSSDFEFSEHLMVPLTWVGPLESFLEQHFSC